MIKKNTMNNIYRYLAMLLIIAGGSFTFSSISAQTASYAVDGKVTSLIDDTPLIGVSVLIKDSSKGTITDVDGKYNLTVDDLSTTLIFTYIGYKAQEVVVNGQKTIDIEMEEEAALLENVVVTALGISREEKSLGYSVGRVDGEELTRVAHENVLNSLSGKVSGVTISSTGGAGSTVNMVIRGATSMTTDNQPLFVVDGVPIASTANNIGGFGSDNRVDYGNAIADLDPESIESVSILKGPSAAALYGTRAGNGVVLITTKKAEGENGLKVSVTSNTVFDVPTRYLNTHTRFSSGFFSFTPENVGGAVLPNINASDGTNSGPENDKGYWAVQWDAPLDANGMPIPTEVVSYPNNFKNFINDYALTTTNGVSIANSSATSSYRLGVTNMQHSGLVPNSDLHKTSLSLAASSKMNDKLTISTNINFANNFADNRPASNRGANPLQWAFFHPTNIDLQKLEDYAVGNSVKRVSEGHENPYYLAYGINNSFNRYRIYGNLTANWKISPSFNIMGRFTMNKFDDVRESKIDPGYLREPNNGAYGIATSNGLERNMDVLATYSKDFKDFTFSLSAGGNVLYSKASATSNSSKTGAGLIVPNVYTISNISSGSLNFSNFRSEKGINSVYALANLGWKNMVYLDLTARNDWSSTLPSENRSYFYPSASVSLLLNEVFSMGNSIDLFKIRGGWAQVGNDAAPYQLFPTFQNAGQWGDATRLGQSGSLLSPNLLPEESTSFEIGADIRLFSNRLRFEITRYTIENKNQILSVPLASSTGFRGVNINAGLLESEGLEFLLGITPVKSRNWTWDLNFNYSQNETRIIELADEVEFIQFWDEARVRNTGFVQNDALGRDGLVGNLYSRKVRRVDDVNSPYHGYPILGSGLDSEWEKGDEFEKVGNYNPDFILGMQSAVSYKNFTLSMTFDWRKGGQFVSQTSRYLSESVITKTWLDGLINPGDLGGAPSQELRDWVVANEDEFLLGDNLRPIGGPTPEFGGFPESFSGVTVYDGTFAPGVVGHYDGDGNFVLEQENLGNEGTVFLPYVVSYPWDIGEANLFDADYIKLREISLNYRVSKNFMQKFGVEDVNISIYSRNIMLWTKDSELGVDPERAFQAEASGLFSQGVERYNANPWVVPFGFKIGLTF